MKVSNPDSILQFITSGGNGQLTFVIPVYQRNYEWARENCDQLFDDVINNIPKNGETKFHYFGNIVYDEVDHDPFTNYIQYVLIDGQQRITSTMLLLAAIRDEEEDKQARENIDITYLRNQNAPEEYKVKLKQVEMDRDTFAKIINNDMIDINKSSPIYKNYDRFRTLTREAKVKGINSKDLILGLRAMNVIVIDLESKLPNAESPQVIFESINATGKPLTAAALLRNFLLFEIGLEKQEKYYTDYWLKIEKNIGSNNVSDFLLRYLVLRLRSKVVKDTEYKVFKRKYHELFTDAESAMSELVKYSIYYQWIKQPETLTESPSTAKLLREADLLRTEPAIPTFMWLLDKVQSNQMEFSDFDEILKLIMDWSFRARVTGIISTGDIGNILLSKILEILESKPADDGRSYGEYLRFELSNYRTRDIYPTDRQFKEAFVKYNFYKTYGRYTQEKLSEAYSNDKHISFESIEHILPQTLDLEKWPHITIAEHAEWVNTIGNLVPMNQKDNSSNSNEDITTKAERLKKSDWLLARDSLKYMVDDEWTVESIKNRAADLAKKAIQIWQGPMKRTRDIEAPSQKKTNENMIKLINMVREFELPDIITTPNQERNSCYFSFHTETMNNLYDSENGSNIYIYEIIVDSERRWNQVSLVIINVKPELITPYRRKIHDKLIEMSSNKPKQNWQYFKVIRWDNTAEDEDEDEEKLFEVLSEKIPEYERRLRQALEE